MSKTSRLGLVVLLAWCSVPKGHAAESDLDTSFGGNPYAGATGVLFDTTNSTLEDRGMLVAESSAGIVLAGSVNTVAGGTDIGLARLSAAGALDTAFGVSGKRVIGLDLVQAGIDSPTSLAIDSQGRYVLGVRATNGAGAIPMVLRLTPSGSLDTSFDSDGIRQITDLSYNFFGGAEVAIGANDSVYVGVPAQLVSGGSQVVYLTQLSSTGAIVSGFGTAGVTAISVSGSSFVSVNQLAVLNNLVFYCGGALNGSNANWLIGSVSSQGTTPQQSVVAVSDTATPDFGRHVCHAVIPSRIVSRVYFAGGARVASANGAAILARSPSLAVDPGFSGDGEASFVVASGATVVSVEGLVERASGKLLFAGSYTDAANGGDSFAGQLLSHGVLDPDFDPSGFRTYAGYGTAGRTEYFASVVEVGARPVLVGAVQFSGNDYDFFAVALQAPPQLFANGFE